MYPNRTIHAYISAGHMYQTHMPNTRITTLPIYFLYAMISDCISQLMFIFAARIGLEKGLLKRDYKALKELIVSIIIFILIIFSNERLKNIEPHIFILADERATTNANEDDFPIQTCIAIKVDAYDVCYAHKMVEEEDCKNMICYMDKLQSLYIYEAKVMKDDFVKAAICAI
ncbi:hypothetical protein ACJX0J_027752, partial [Zea mays]